jgi:hypothetical protein
VLPDRANLKRMLASLDEAIAGAVKYELDEADFRATFRESVRLLMQEASECDHEWMHGQLEEMMARHGLKDFAL